jgi:hypothetical protein
MPLSTCPVGMAHQWAQNHIHLISPSDSVNMWLFRENHEGVIGFLANGDFLLPLRSIKKRDRILYGHSAARSCPLIGFRRYRTFWRVTSLKNSWKGGTR